MGEGVFWLSRLLALVLLWVILVLVGLHVYDAWVIASGTAGFVVLCDWVGRRLLGH